MNILITGGAGFIGSYLSEALLKEKHTVFVLDDLSTGSMANIEHLKNHPNFHYTINTIMNYQLLSEMADACDIIYHLAAAVGVKLIVDRPLYTIDTNIRGTEKVLEVADKKKKRVVIASTSEVYGKSDKIPFKEDGDMVFGPTVLSRWSYACSKAIDEFLALAYSREKNLSVMIVRFFNTVGPRQTGRYGMVIPRFVQQALKNEPITVYGDGKQSRCFGYVEDVVKAVMDLSGHPKAWGQVFNIGSQEEISIIDLAKKIIHMTGSNSKIQHIPYEQAYTEGFEDMQRRVPDVTKIQNLIGFKQKTSLEFILKKVIESFRK